MQKARLDPSEITWLNSMSQVDWFDPAPVLVRLRSIEEQLAASATPPKIKNLRAQTLKEYRELRQAAIFCHGLGERFGQKVFVGRGEAHDYDCVALRIEGDTQHFYSIQLKELVPEELNPNASLQKLIDQLPRKYPASPKLTVAIYLNRECRFESDELYIPPMSISSLWVYGLIGPSTEDWGMWGNFLETPLGSRFTYPTAARAESA